MKNDLMLALLSMDAYYRTSTGEINTKQVDTEGWKALDRFHMATKDGLKEVTLAERSYSGYPQTGDKAHVDVHVAPDGGQTVNVSSMDNFVGAGAGNDNSQQQEAV